MTVPRRVVLLFISHRAAVNSLLRQRAASCADFGVLNLGVRLAMAMVVCTLGLQALPRRRRLFRRHREPDGQRVGAGTATSTSL